MTDRARPATPFQPAAGPADQDGVSAGRAAAGRWSAWLRGSVSDHARYQDMHARFGSARLFGVAVGGSTSLAAVTYGWWLLVLPVLGAATMAAGLSAYGRTERPEVTGAVSFTLLEINLAVSVLLTDGAHSPLLPLMLVPVFTQAVCFRPQVTGAWVALSAVLALAAIGAATALPDAPVAPLYLSAVCYLALLAALALAAHLLAAADVRSRDQAVLDPLTGLFNRTALEGHFSDLRARACSTDADLGVLMCDIDHFKSVNDTSGHEQGDLVLRQVADRLCRTVRGTDLVYRVGGEEFLVLLSGHDLAAAARVAERLRRDVADDPVAGLPVTVSVGVVAARGPEISFSRMAREADAALYRAKRDGRNCVRLARPEEPAAA